MSIELQKVDFAYGNTTVCRELSWRLPLQGIVCLWGASGCGKTTLLRLLCGLEQPQAGRIVRPADLRTAVCFQEDRLLPWRTALENVCIAAGCGREEAAALLARMGLADCAGQYPASLSGGQCRRVALARALAMQAGLLLLDEPFTGLDAAAWRAILPLIRERAAQCPVVLVTHVAEEAQALGAAVLPLDTIPLTGTLKIPD